MRDVTKVRTSKPHAKKTKKKKRSKLSEKITNSWGQQTIPCMSYDNDRKVIFQESNNDRSMISESGGAIAPFLPLCWGLVIVCKNVWNQLR